MTRNTDINPVTTRRIISTLFATKSLHSTGQMVIFTVASIIAVRLTGSEASAGVPATLSTLGRVVGAYPFGWLMDRVGRRLGISIAFMAASVGAGAGALSVLQGIYWMFIAGSFLIGMSRSAIEQTRYVAAEVSPRGKRAKAIGLIVFSSAVGSLASRMVMGINDQLTEIIGITYLAGPWLLTIVLMGIAILLNQVFLRPDPMRLGQQGAAREEDSETRSTRTMRPMGEIFRLPNVIMAVAVMALAQIGMVVVMVVTPLHIDYEGYGTLSISTALMLHTLGMFAFASIPGWLVGRLGRMPVVWMGVILMFGAGFAGYAAVTLVSLYFAVFLLGLGWNLCYIAGSTLFSDELISQERGRAQGISEVVVAMSAAVGSLASGSIYGAYGYSGVNIAALAVVGFIAISVLITRGTVNAAGTFNTE